MPDLGSSLRRVKNIKPGYHRFNMSNVSENERRILYISLFIIILLALFMQWTSDQLMSLGALFFVVVVALTNIAYLYRRRKKTATS